MTMIITLIVAAVTFGTVLMFGTLGEILTEKSGNLNLGVEGIMYMGGAFGLAGAFYYEKAAGAAASGPAAIIIAILSAFAAGMAASLIYSFITVTLRANQNVTGLALSIFGTGIGQFVGEFMRVSEGGYVALSNHRNDIPRFPCEYTCHRQHIVLAYSLLLYCSGPCGPDAYLPFKDEERTLSYSSRRIASCCRRSGNKYHAI